MLIYLMPPCATWARTELAEVFSSLSKLSTASTFDLRPHTWYESVDEGQVGGREAEWLGSLVQ